MRRLTYAVLAIALAAVACGGNVGAGGSLVGAACTSDRDCDRRCLLGDSNYPGGMCTVACASDGDCPAGTSCVDDEGGICAVNCQAVADCADFGRGYTCDAKGRRGASGDALVCRVD